MQVNAYNSIYNPARYAQQLSTEDTKREKLAKIYNEICRVRGELSIVKSSNEVCRINGNHSECNWAKESELERQLAALQAEERSIENSSDD